MTDDGMKGQGRPGPGRAMHGAIAWMAGDLAERSVARHYEAAGCTILARRWRGAAGEIDLIVDDGEATVFVEVKKAATCSAAALRLGRRQMDRICRAACEFAGMDGNMRFDVALVDAHGAIEIITNAFGGD